MDIFQLIGDMLHLVAMLLLLTKILANKNVTALSYKTQQLYLVVFITRYMNILMGWKSVYIFIMKILFINITGYTIYIMRSKKPYCLSYDKQFDSFPHYYLYIAGLFMAVIIHKSLNPLDFAWSFSIWLEALAVLPQILMVYKLRNVENITANYLLLLGLYRIFYVFHWILNWDSLLYTSFLAGIIQSVLYADFIYYYFRCSNIGPVQLPAYI